MIGTDSMHVPVKRQWITQKWTLCLVVCGGGASCHPNRLLIIYRLFQDPPQSVGHHISQKKKKTMTVTPRLLCWINCAKFLSNVEVIIHYFIKTLIDYLICRLISMCSREQTIIFCRISIRKCYVKKTDNAFKQSNCSNPSHVLYREPCNVILNCTKGNSFSAHFTIIDNVLRYITFVTVHFSWSITRNLYLKCCPWP